MDHITIEAALRRLQQVLNMIPANIGRLSEQDAARAITPKATCEYFGRLCLCIDHLAQVIKRIAAKQNMLSDDGGYKF